jgi:hypothetical protein
VVQFSLKNPKSILQTAGNRKAPNGIPLATI